MPRTRVFSLPRLIFASRWLQLPLYLGLIVAQAVFVVEFWIELVELIRAALGDQASVRAIWCAVSNCHFTGSGAAQPPDSLSETLVMLAVLALIDVVLISNLLVMVIIGGYETFVCRLGLDDHPDEPQWLSHINAGVLKVKLSLAIIGISAIHLLKTFINADQYDAKTLAAQVCIHLAFLLSAWVMAKCDRLIGPAEPPDALRLPREHRSGSPTP
jgi:uncharacterized protein (TIGR00645 family)